MQHASPLAYGMLASAISCAIIAVVTLVGWLI